MNQPESPRLPNPSGLPNGRLQSEESADPMIALNEFSLKLQQATLKTADIRASLTLLQEYASLRIVYYSFVERSFCLPELPFETNEDSDALKQFERLVNRQPASSRRRLRLTLTNGQAVLAQAVVGLGQVLSYIGIVLPNDGTNRNELYLALLLEYASKSAEQLLLRRILLDNRASEGQSRLVQDILFGEVSHEDQMLAQIGLPSLGNGKYVFVAGVLVLERPEREQGAEHQPVHSLNQDIVMLLRSLLSTHGIYNLLLLQNNVIHLLCIRESFSNANAQWEKIKQSLSTVIELLKRSNRLAPANRLNLLAGFGYRKTRLRDAALSYREALDVVSVTRTLDRKPISAFYEDMGIYQVLKSIGSSEQLIRFVQSHLGGLLAYDQENGAPLLQTLDQYLSCMGSKQETAERLFIHRQTLYHRLEKLEELLGDDYLRADRRLSLEVAIRAYDLVKGEMETGTAS